MENNLSLPLSLMLNLILGVVVLMLVNFAGKGPREVASSVLAMQQLPTFTATPRPPTPEATPQLPTHMASPQGSKYQWSFPENVNQVMIDIGLYKMILQPKADEWVIAVDASVREIERFKLHSMCYEIDRCWLINAAVGDSQDTFILLRQSKREGGSSHVNAGDSQKWPMEMKSAIVTIISLKTLIDAVPGHLPIPLCKTDTNGNDLAVIISAGESLKRCERITMEIVGNADHVGPVDQYEKAIEVASAQGFQLAPGKPSKKKGGGSYNLFFVRPDIAAKYDEHLAE